MNTPEQWQSWIGTRLAAGASEQTIIDGLIASQVDPGVAIQAVRQYRQQQGAGAAGASPDSFIYEPPRLPPGASIDAGDREVLVRMRIARPRITVLENVLSPEECDTLIELAEQRLEPSMVIIRATGERVQSETRTSKGATFALNENPFIAKLDRRISSLMQISPEYGEGLHVLRYNEGDQFKPHHDYTNPNVLANQQKLATYGQRVATLIMYLNEVEDGGSTAFIQIGAQVMPRRGGALYFEYTNSKGQVDASTEHAGFPVLKGQKWIVTKWVRDRPQR